MFRRKKNTNRRKATRRRMQVENLEKRELLVAGWGSMCVCDGGDHSGNDTNQGGGGGNQSNDTVASSRLQGGSQTATLPAGKPVAQTFEYGRPADAVYAEISLSVNGSPSDAWGLVDVSHVPAGEPISLGATIEPGDSVADPLNAIRLADYTMEVTWQEADGSEIYGDSASGQVMLEDRTDSIFGTGWSNDDYQFIVVDGNDVVWKRADNQTAYFDNVGSSSGNSNSVPGDLTFAAGSYTYDSGMGEVATFQRVTNASGSPITSDPRFFLTSFTDSEGKLTSYSYVDGDADGQKDEIYQVTTEDGRTKTFAYSDNELGAGDYRLDTITDYAGRVTNFDYVTTTGLDRGFLSGIREPEVTNHESSLEQPTTLYSYLASGKVETITNAVGDDFTNIYDAHQRVVAEIDFDGSVYTYDSALGRALYGAQVNTYGSNGDPVDPNSSQVAYREIYSEKTDERGFTLTTEMSERTVNYRALDFRSSRRSLSISHVCSG